MEVVTRFAPSPTGYLHLGHAFAAFNAWRRARVANGEFLLRLEDIDRARCHPEFAEAIQQDLKWLGLDWDGPVRVQSACLADYKAVVDRLSSRGLIYPCFCTRGDIAASASAAHGPDGTPVYPGTCKRLSNSERSDRIAKGERYALRLDIAAALQSDIWYIDNGEAFKCQPDEFGDVVLARKDVPASYHLCVTHDDALQGVTLVTRGIDLKPATDIHRLLQQIMGWQVPSYAHHGLLLDNDGNKLSKRNKTVTLRSLRADGMSARDVLRRIDQS